MLRYCLPFLFFVFPALLYAQSNTPARANVQTSPALKETTRISNQSGAKLIADFYCSSENENMALSPPSMISAYSAFAHIAKGKTQKELQKLLFLNGKEKPAFGTLNDYLSRHRDESSDQYDTSGYFSRGYLLMSNRANDLSSDAKKEIEDKFATTFRLTDFSEADLTAIYKEIVPITKGAFEDVVIEADPDSICVILTAMNLETSWTWEMKNCDNPLPFKFDKGRQKIPFLKGNVNGYQSVTVNSKSGYLFPLQENVDMMIVPCKNGTALKQLAKTISKEGLRINPGRKVLRQTGLYMPTVCFETEFDFKEYAQAKGCSTAFSEEAEFIISDSARLPMYCNEARTMSIFRVDKQGIELVQITVIEFAVALEEERRIPKDIVIDSPYMMLLTERNLGTVLGMAFIAAPEYDWEKY